MYKRFVKHVLDFLTACIGLVVLSPVFLLVTTLLFITNRGTPFFCQARPGKDEKMFKIIKFKTMNNRTDSDGVLLPDAARLTTVGKFVRKTSLDEIPQLINIIKGDMSLIGPRPLLPEYLSVYTHEQKKRHLVRPGVTGLAQVKGRNQMKFSKRLQLDVFYVENLSFFLDAKIFLMTVKSVIFKTDTIVLGQTVDEIDDIGLSRNLGSNHFKKKQS